MTNESQMPSTSLNQTVNGRLQEKSGNLYIVLYNITI